MHLIKPIHPSITLLAFLVGIIIGDIFALIFRTTFFESFWWLILALILFVFALLVPRRLTLVFALISGLIIPCFRICPELKAEQYYQNLYGQTITITAKVAKDPTESASGKYSLVLADEAAGGTIFTQVSSLQINDSYKIQRSDVLTLSGELSEGFGSYTGTIFRPTIKNFSRPEPGDIFLKIRDFFSEKIKDYIPSPESGLALGFLLGQKSGVDQTFQDTLRIVGLTHIVVASGAHLGTLTSAAKKIFGKFSRFAGALAGGLMTLFFIGITGLSPSMLRAGLVTGISLIFNYYGRKIAPERLIIFVAALTLIYNPNYLTDLAWLLSFGSFTGILIVAPRLINFFYGPTRQPNFVFSNLISSFSAALICTPILLYFFGQTSLISIIANLLVLPTVSIAMGLTFFTGFFSLFLPPLAALFGRLALLILDYQISVINFFGEQKIFLVSIDPENPLVFLWYIPLVVVFILSACYSKYKSHTILSVKSKNKI